MDNTNAEGDKAGVDFSEAKSSDSYHEEEEDEEEEHEQPQASEHGFKDPATRPSQYDPTKAKLAGAEREDGCPEDLRPVLDAFIQKCE